MSSYISSRRSILAVDSAVSILKCSGENHWTFWPNRASLSGEDGPLHGRVQLWSHFDWGLGQWERPIITRRFSFDHPQELKENMVFAVETWCGTEDGSGAARIEEEVVVTKDGCEILTNYPSDHLISCGVPGSEVYV